METNQITVAAEIAAPIQKVWQAWSDPEQIKKWCAASEDWHVPQAENDLRNGGKFSTRMEAKDGSFGFDFEGVYTDVVPHRRIAYIMADGRTVSILFEDRGESTTIAETFDPETVNPVEMQRDGWQAILDNFKKHAESAA